MSRKASGMSRGNWLVHREFVVIDFEAVTPKGSPALPIELAAVAVTGDPTVEPVVLLDTFIGLEDPSLLTPFDTTQTGISAAMIEGAPRPSQVLQDLSDALSPTAALVAHNAGFERNVIANTADLPDPLANTRFLDTLRLARALLPYGRHNLDAPNT